MASEERTLEIYCDGGCRGNGSKENVGGYGIVYRYGSAENTYYGSEHNTTNNRMELKACIEALSKISVTNVPVVLTTDSTYVVMGVMEWSQTWTKNGWKNSKGKPVENMELWQALLEQLDRLGNLRFVHCKGHGSVDGNILADKLANVAMDKLERGP